ncbi:MAG: glycosyltransferase [Candidatus Altiarchaeota archaeon]|nr:glycosyltransferase [Candidatus Altiarchaeota archaeon]
MKLSVVLPTYNEKKNIQILIPQIQEFFKKEAIDGEVVVVDDSSPDGTAREAEKLNKKFKNVRVVLREKKEGLGAALRDGYNAAKGDIILSMDSDLSLNVKDAKKFLGMIEHGDDLVLGSRHSKDGYYEKKSFHTEIKSVISTLGNLFTRLATGVNVPDFSLNFRAMKKNVWRSIKTEEKKNAFLLEMIVRIHSKGYKIGWIPVAFKDRIYGESKMQLSRQAPLFLKKAIEYGLKYR